MIKEKDSLTWGSSDQRTEDRELNKTDMMMSKERFQQKTKSTSSSHKGTVSSMDDARKTSISSRSSDQSTERDRLNKSSMKISKERVQPEANRKSSSHKKINTSPIKDIRKGKSSLTQKLSDDVSNQLIQTSEPVPDKEAQSRVPKFKTRMTRRILK